MHDVSSYLNVLRVLPEALHGSHLHVKAFLININNQSLYEGMFSVSENALWYLDFWNLISISLF